MAALSCLAVLSFPGWAQDPNSTKGIVIGVTGDWMLGSRHLSLGDPLHVGDTVTPGAGTLTLWFEGHRPDVYPCSPGGPCKHQIHLPEADPSPPRKSLLDLVASFFPKEPSRYFAAASRSLEGDLKEAVVLLQGSQVDVAPTFADLSGETYWVRFESFGENAWKTAPTQVRWHPGKPALASAAGLNPGLYRLTLLEQSGETAGSEAWVLLSGPQEYPTTSTAFQEAVNTVATWPASVDPTATRAVLRASLEALSKQQKGPARP
jgi:hypothetical protein